MTQVFIPYVPTRFHKMLNSRIPSFDVSSMEVFGDLVQCVSQDKPAKHIDYPAAFDEIATVMAQYQPGDYVACCGDPVLIAAVMDYAAERGPLKVLRYNKSRDEYFVTEIPTWK